MKTEFSIFKRNQIFKPINFYYLVGFYIILIFIIPFFPWFIQQAQGFSLDIVISYVQHTIQHFPISNKQESAFIAAIIFILAIILLALILPLVKLVITPEKIYYSLFNIPLLTVIERNSIEYSQFAIIKLKLNRLETFFTQHHFRVDSKQSKAKLYFFPLHQIQNSFYIEQLDQDQRNQVIQLLKQHYNFQDDCAEIILDRQAINELRQKQLNTKISPRIAFVLVSCIPIGALGMILTTYAPFFFLTNYPIVPVFSFILCLIVIPSYHWIKKDIGTFAFLGAFLASIFVTVAIYAFLFPLLHAYYTNSYGKTIDFPATLIEIQAERQIWESKEIHQKFFINKKHPTYMPDLALNEQHIFSVKYHWHNYVFSDDAFINDKNEAHKKDR